MSLLNWGDKSDWTFRDKTKIELGILRMNFSFFKFQLLFLQFEIMVYFLFTIKNKKELQSKSFKIKNYKEPKTIDSSKFCVQHKMCQSILTTINMGKWDNTQILTT